MDTTHTFPLPFDEPVRVEQISAIVILASAAPALSWPDSDNDDVARQAWNLHADQRPACICVARSVADVQAAVAYAREAGLTVAAQGTGHLGQALPSLERTLLLKTALHHGEVEVDPIDAPPGSRPAPAGVMSWRWCSPMGWPSCTAPRLRSGGYLLAGGLSFYGRKHGLAVNHVREPWRCRHPRRRAPPRRRRAQP